MYFNDFHSINSKISSAVALRFEWKIQFCRGFNCFVTQDYWTFVVNKYLKIAGADIPNRELSKFFYLTERNYNFFNNYLIIQ